MLFAFHKYQGNVKILTVKGIDVYAISELICETHDDIDQGHCSSYKVERVECPGKMRLCSNTKDLRG